MTKNVIQIPGKNHPLRERSNIMSTATLTKAASTITLCAETAADLMRTNPVSIREDATIREAIALLTDKGFSAAPVIDDAGHPVGVLSRSDILVHDRERVEYVPDTPEFYHRERIVTEKGEMLRSGFQVENVDKTLVRDIMTPAIFSVTPKTPAARVVAELLALNVHRLFVVEPSGVLVGVISTLDVLAKLQ
jgi:CBS domain-containing protein